MILQRPLFKYYIERKYGNYNQFLSLKGSDKEALYLKYKWGSENDHVNRDLEACRRAIMHVLKSYEMENEKNVLRKQHFLNLMAWEDSCYEIKKEIGLVKVEDVLDRPGIIQEAEKIFQ